MQGKTTVSIPSFKKDHFLDDVVSRMVSLCLLESSNHVLLVVHICITSNTCEMDRAQCQTFV